MTLAGCGLDTQTVTTNKINTVSTKTHTVKQYPLRDEIDISKYYLKPIATPSFNSKDEIVKSFESILRAEKDCRIKLYKLKKEVLEKQERNSQR